MRDLSQLPPVVYELLQDTAADPEFWHDYVRGYTYLSDAELTARALCLIAVNDRLLCKLLETELNEVIRFDLTLARSDPNDPLASEIESDMLAQEAVYIDTIKQIKSTM